MIFFQKLIWQNFLSAGNKPLEVDLSSSPSTLVVGINGTGKSTILDALSFVLFGKPHRDITKPQLINSINGKNCLVQIDFQIESDKYMIKRGMKPTIFEIWKNGTMLNQDSHTKDYQDVLEEQILKLNHKSFHQIVVLGSSSFVPFMKLPSHFRREVIEDLLGIRIFSEMNKLAKEKSSKIKESVQGISQKIELLRSNIVLQKKNIISLEKVEEDIKNQTQEEIASLEIELAKLETEKCNLATEFNKDFPSVDEAIQKANKKLQKFDSFKTQFKGKTTEHKELKTFFSENLTCPTCRQVINEEFRQNKISEIQKNIDELAEAILLLNSDREKHVEIMQKIQDQWAELKKLDVKSLTIQSSINTMNRQLVSLKAKLQKPVVVVNEVQKESELAKSRPELTTMESSYETALSDKETLVEERTYHELILEMLKDAGIKTKIIKQYLPVMNQYINKHLTVLDFFVSFTLDEEFSEKILSRYRDEFSFASFSEGEKMRINLAILFTWRHVAKLKNSANTNLLILDETFDSSLDDDGVDNLMKILSTLTSTNVFIITHKPDALFGKVSRTITFHKPAHFSEMVIE